MIKRLKVWLVLACAGVGIVAAGAACDSVSPLYDAAGRAYEIVKENPTNFRTWAPIWYIRGRTVYDDVEMVAGGAEG